MTAAELLTLAANLTGEQVDKAAHALGWPDRANLLRPRGSRRPKWASPYRNGYSCAVQDGWEELVSLGLALRAEHQDAPGTVTYWLTSLGIAVVRARLKAELEAKRLAGGGE